MTPSPLTERSPLDPLPICLGCWRQRFGMYEPLPPPPHDWPEEICATCGNRTNHGLYLLRGRERQGSSAGSPSAGPSPAS